MKYYLIYINCDCRVKRSKITLRHKLPIIVEFVAIVNETNVVMVSYAKGINFRLDDTCYIVVTVLVYGPSRAVSNAIVSTLS